jgi:hypothetical protein
MKPFRKKPGVGLKSIVPWLHPDWLQFLLKRQHFVLKKFWDIDLFGHQELLFYLGGSRATGR